MPTKCFYFFDSFSLSLFILSFGEAQEDGKTKINILGPRNIPQNVGQYIENIAIVKRNI